MEGYIKLHRQILEWGWYEDANTFRLFMHLLLKANYYDSEFKGRIVKRGQRFTSIGNLAKEIKLSDKAIRISLDKLIRTNEVVLNGANNGTMITICKYDTYQGNSETEGQTKGKPKGKRGATNKEEEEIQEEKEIINTVFSFDDFWNVYPNKAAKSESEKKYAKLSENDRSIIKATMNDFINNIPFKDYHHPMATTYINQKRWVGIESKQNEWTEERIKREFPNSFIELNGVKKYYKPNWL